MLKEIIRKSGITPKELAVALGMPVGVFKRKLRNGSFGIKDANILSEQLNITNPSEIFFDEKQLDKLYTTKVKYKIFKEYFSDTENKYYKSYGITVIEKSVKHRRIYDISGSYTRMKRLCFICNLLKLAPEHIDDVIEDFLADET